MIAFLNDGLHNFHMKPTLELYTHSYNGASPRTAPPILKTRRENENSQKKKKNPPHRKRREKQHHYKINNDRRNHCVL